MSQQVGNEISPVMPSTPGLTMLGSPEESEAPGSEVVVKCVMSTAL